LSNANDVRQGGEYGGEGEVTHRIDRLATKGCVVV
jgi:hypothetical protein